VRGDFRREHLQGRAGLAVLAIHIAPRTSKDEPVIIYSILGGHPRMSAKSPLLIPLKPAEASPNLLAIELQREIPEEKKARAIPIAAEPVQSAISH
jgi:hypothetical protein